LYFLIPLALRKIPKKSLALFVAIVNNPARGREKSIAETESHAMQKQKSKDPAIFSTLSPKGIDSRGGVSVLVRYCIRN